MTFHQLMILLPHLPGAEMASTCSHGFVQTQPALYESASPAIKC
ncbi:rCG51819, isoform CRA_b [Rattus norvegicus]|uniref:RCG51819, isoform CRA_b n=1 Tax=Rattus norvegicus TaxID=10116 RepID=A6K326_RAT|nr:rCG51819, isoform CRA_b [Rattus norvegicus]